MLRIFFCMITFLIIFPTFAEGLSDKSKIERAVLDYIESQHNVKPEQMKRSLDEKLAKRTYWLNKAGEEFLLETSYDYMLYLAENYNKDGDKFPKSPKVLIKIFDIDQRAASVKLTVDDWIDYMHLYKSELGDWKVVNVFWQFHDISRHQSAK